jgi:hypothetical protein
MSGLFLSRKTLSVEPDHKQRNSYPSAFVESSTLKE